MRGRVLLLSVSLILALSATGLTPIPPPCSAATFYPAYAPPSGGEIVILNGYFHLNPTRVFFGSKEAFVVSRTDGQIVVVSPPFDIEGDAPVTVPVRVTVGAGTASELTCIYSEPFSIRLTPAPEIITVSPRSGSYRGGTRVTIFGDWFEMPLRAFFGGNEAQVLAVSPKQVTVISPSDGAGPTDVRVVNINTNKEVTLSGGYRYRYPMLITSTAAMGERLTIYGTSFDDPVLVTIGGQVANVLQADPGHIVVRVPALNEKDCASVDVTVTDIETGEMISTEYDYHCNVNHREPQSPSTPAP